MGKSEKRNLASREEKAGVRGSAFIWTALRRTLNSLTLQGQKQTGFLCDFQGKQKCFLVPIVLSSACKCMCAIHICGMVNTPVHRVRPKEDSRFPALSISALFFETVFCFCLFCCLFLCVRVCDVYTCGYALTHVCGLIYVQLCTFVCRSWVDMGITITHSSNLFFEAEAFNQPKLAYKDSFTS